MKPIQNFEAYTFKGVPSLFLEYTHNKDGDTKGFVMQITEEQMKQIQTLTK